MALQHMIVPHLSAQTTQNLLAPLFVSAGLYTLVHNETKQEAQPPADVVEDQQDAQQDSEQEPAEVVDTTSAYGRVYCRRLAMGALLTFFGLGMIRAQQ